MALMILNISAQANQPPSSSGWNSIALDYNELYVFTLADFTTNTSPPYADPEGDALKEVKITTLPTQGVISLSGIPILANAAISSANIVAGNLKYQADVLDTDGYENGDMMFTVSDVGSSTFTTVPERFTFMVAAQENQPPSEVGDGTMDLLYGQTGTFTRAMFTTGTIPAYADPESDAALNLKVTGLPALGNIQLDGVNIILNQVISFEDIDAGLLTYVPDLADTDGDMQGFTFEIADAGSLNYTA